MLAGCGAKSGLWEPGEDADAEETDSYVPPDLPPEALCLDTELWTAPDKFTVVEARGTDDRPSPGFLWTIVSAPAGSTATLSPTRAEHTTITPDRLGDYRLRFTVTDSADQSDSCSCLLHAVENPPTALCPPDVADVPIGLPVTLEGDGIDVDGYIAGFLWSIRDAPEGASPTLVPDDEASTSFTGDVEGVYEVRFEVIDDRGYRGQCIVTVTLVGAPPLDCPETEITGRTRRALTIPAIPVLSGESVTWSWQLVEFPPGSSGPVPTPPSAASPSLTPDKPGRYLLRATATNARGLSSTCDVVVVATPSGPDAVCPGETCTVPLNEITLNGSGLDDGTIVAYRWELVERPEGSSARPPEPADAATTTFMPDVAGRFLLRLTVTDDDGNTGSCELPVVAVPSEGLRVEMFWNPPDRSCPEGERPPGCDGSDVDLHLLHPSASSWFSGEDCYYANCNATYGYVLEWDASGRDDNPRLDLDDTEGYGPENINIDDPVVGHEYWVGVHYYYADGWGPAEIHVKVYCASTSGECESGPPVEFGPITLRDADDSPSDDNEFWRVAAVTWNGATCTVRSLAGADGTPNITTYATARRTR